MTQTVALVAVLGASQTGEAIGYRVLDLAGDTYSAFTVDDVVETAIPGTYRVENGIVAPSEGGTVIVGTVDADLAEAAIDPATPGNAGPYSKVYTITVGGMPLAGVYCRLTTDVAGTMLVSSGISNGLGQVTFWHDLPVGTTVYVHAAPDGYDPLVDQETI